MPASPFHSSVPSTCADGLPRFPAPVEAAAYFACLEAVQNAHKHAGDGASVVVRLTDGDGALRFVVEDDGVGSAATGVVDGLGRKIVKAMATKLDAEWGRDESHSGMRIRLAFLRSNHPQTAG